MAFFCADSLIAFPLFGERIDKHGQAGDVVLTFIRCTNVRGVGLSMGVSDLDLQVARFR